MPDAPSRDASSPAPTGRPASSLVIRSATVDDVPTILAFIRELADYEQLSSQVEATPAALARTLFGERPAAEVVIARLDDRDVGFALFFETYSTFLAARGMHLEDLYVRPEARGHGVGRALFTYLAALADARGYGRLEWAVLAWNAPAIGFYQQMGGFSLDDWRTFRLNREGLQRLAGTGHPSRTP